MINFHRGSSRMELLRNFLIFCLCIVAANAEANFYVLKSTSKSLSFEGSSTLKSAEIGAVALASTGLSISDDATWDGMYMKDPFDLPTVAVIIHIEDAQEISFKTAQHTYGVEGNAATSALTKLKDVLKSSLCDINLNKFDDAANVIKNCFPGTDVSASEDAEQLKLNVAEDKAVLDAVTAINAIADNAKALTDSTEFVFLRFSLQALKKVHESEQASIDEAVNLLETAVDKLQNELVAAKAEKVVVFAIVTEGGGDESATDAPLDDTTTGVTDASEDSTTPEEDVTTEAETNTEDISDGDSDGDGEGDGGSRRHKRSVVAGSKTNTYNLAVYYNQDYPVIFNIILWFMVSFGFSLLAVCYAIGDMDPGRDSIIYRMTSTRMKKDN